MFIFTQRILGLVNPALMCLNFCNVTENTMFLGPIGLPSPFYLLVYFNKGSVCPKKHYGGTYETQISNLSHLPACLIFSLGDWGRNAIITRTVGKWMKPMYRTGWTLLHHGIQIYSMCASVMIAIANIWKFITSTLIEIVCTLGNSRLHDNGKSAMTFNNQSPLNMAAPLCINTFELKILRPRVLIVFGTNPLTLNKMKPNYRLINPKDGR